MSHKNTFRFAVCAAVVSVALGLSLSACGDSGSTTPNPLQPEGKSYQVVFNYNVLA